jgi:AraC-like DNA-binding protein
MNGYTSVLSPYIKEICVLERPELKEGNHVFNIYADGCPGLMYHESEHGVFRNGVEKLDPLILYGQTVEPMTLSATGDFMIILVVLQPHVLGPLFAIRASEITDSCISVNDLPFGVLKNVSQVLREAATREGKVELLKKSIDNAVRAVDLRTDLYIQHAVSMIHHRGGNVVIRDVYEKLHMTEKTFERRFDQIVGVSAKTFSSICRFRASMEKIRTGEYTNLSDIAFDMGFADQSHFIRSFKRFTGESPGRFLKIKELV